MLPILMGILVSLVPIPASLLLVILILIVIWAGIIGVVLALW